MYQLSYAENLEANPAHCRDRERRALDHAICLLQRAEAAGMRSPAATQALSFLGTLWKAFIEDLVSPDNDLPDVLRADLVSVGLWVLREADTVRVGQSENWRGLIEICTLIRDGLK